MVIYEISLLEYIVLIAVSLNAGFVWGNLWEKQKKNLS